MIRRNVAALLNAPQASTDHEFVRVETSVNDTGVKLTTDSESLVNDPEVFELLFGDSFMKDTMNAVQGRAESHTREKQSTSDTANTAVSAEHSSGTTTASLYGIYVLQALGDLVVTSQIAKQLKHDEPDCHVVWFVLKKNAFVLKGNPYIDEIVELEGKNSDWDARVEELKAQRPWTRFLIPQPHLAYAECPGGDLTELVKAAVKLEWTVPYVPVMRLDDDEVQRARDYVKSLPSGLRILVETEFQSEQSPWSVEYAAVMIDRLKHLNPIFIFSAKNEPAYLNTLRTLYSRIEWCQLPFRENAELYNHVDAFVGVSSGISCLSYSDWCKTDVPHVEVVNNTHWSSFHFTHHTKRRLCFEEQSFVVSLDWLAKVLEGRLSGSENPQTKRMDLYMIAREGKYTTFCKTIIPSTYALKEDLRTMAMTLMDFPDFYLICGNVDDAMLTLSKALDENKLINVIVCSPFFNDLRPFFDEHSLIRNVFVIPYPTHRPESQTHLMLQMAHQPNCKGIGMKWSDPTVRPFFTDERIAELTGFKANPAWARHEHPKNRSLRVVIETRAASSKGYRSERRLINPRWWRALITLLTDNGIQPIIVGDQEYSAVYAVDEKCSDLRSESAQRQFRELRDADLFIGSDSMFLTIAAMYSTTCIRCVPMRGHDLRFYDDPAMRMLRDQWSNMQSVDSRSELIAAVTDYIESVVGNIVTTHRANTDLGIGELPRISDRTEQLSSFHSIFWNRDYANASSVLIRCSTAVGDSLMITNVIRELKRQHSHLHLTLSGTAASLAVFENNNDVSECVPRDSAEELLCEATADIVVEFNHIIDQFPEYYNGLHLQDILGNIAGVTINNRRIQYAISKEEQQFADACMQKFFGSSNKPFVLGLHLFTEKDAQRSYRHASGLIEYLTHMFPDMTIINFGQSSFRQNYPQVLDCPRYSDITLRRQIALAAKCHVFICIDSAFFHVAHNLLNKPTLAIQSVVNEFLTGDPSLGNVRTLRNVEHGCRGCYWVPGVCKTECLATLHPQVVAREFAAMIDDIQRSKMPFAIPQVEEEMVVTFDHIGRQLADAFRQNSRIGKNVRPIIIVPHHDQRERCSRWNGIDVVLQDSEPQARDSKKTHAEFFSQTEKLGVLNWS